MHLDWTDVTEMADRLEALDDGPEQVRMLLVAAPHIDELPALVETLSARGVSFFGAVFPGLIAAGQTVRQGLVVRSLRGVGGPFVVDLSEGVSWRSAPPVRESLTDGAISAHVFVDFQAINFREDVLVTVLCVNV